MPAVRERIQQEIRLTDFCRSVHQNSTDEQARKVNLKMEVTTMAWRENRAEPYSTVGPKDSEAG